MESTPPPAAPAEPTRFFPETGQSVSGPFLAFFEHYGLTLCGFPLSGVMQEGGVRLQVFQNLALEEHVPGRVRLRPLGQAWLAQQRAGERSPLPPGGRAAPQIVDLTERLPRHPARRYGTRPLSQIRYLVLHHTGASGALGPAEIADHHVQVNGWPGIGYHFLIQPDGATYQTQDLTTASFHARQFNLAAAGIAVAGDLLAAEPTPAQLDQLAALVAELLADLGLGTRALRGHGEMVSTPCPGGRFLGGWKPRLLEAVADRWHAVAPATTGPAAG
jgi:hypothetical protein